MLWQTICWWVNCLIDIHSISEDISLHLWGRVRCWSNFFLKIGPGWIFGLFEVEPEWGKTSAPFSCLQRSAWSVPSSCAPPLYYSSQDISLLDYSTKDILSTFISLDKTSTFLTNTLQWPRSSTGGSCRTGRSCWPQWGWVGWGWRPQRGRRSPRSVFLWIVYCFLSFFIRQRWGWAVWGWRPWRGRRSPRSVFLGIIYCLLSFIIRQQWAGWGWRPWSGRRSPRSFFFGFQNLYSWITHHTEVKDTIRDGGSTALYTVSVNSVITLFTVISVNMPTPHFYRKYAHPFSEGSFLKILW